MTKISGIFAATMSVLNSDLSLNVDKTIEHAEKLIDQGCHGTAIFGSTGQSQLISISEKIDLINKLSISKYKDKHLIGTGLNSLGETINFMKIASSLKFKKFLIMPPAYYNYGDSEVIKFYTKIINNLDEDSKMLSDLFYRRGGCYERMGEYQQADNDLLHSLKIEPDDAYVLNYLAYSWLERNFKINEAIKMLETAHKIESDDPYIIDSIGWGYYLVNDYHKALW